ncbi:hypothetical protein [Gellertiella hungarica]|uniref:Biotin carboxyl carrier protein of acetyl-CoA carboxylase n=1 Tax=Gellertiella hungarica TaxID=1572859 RepID=A0A7W6NJZ7_9HYPH|nr:hypothetical protein [Gellertiella hungarica]MBB4063865.1 hypothetical protein [Gellertiella hungarica]
MTEGARKDGDTADLADRLIRLLERHDIAEFSYQDAERKIDLVLARSVAAQAAPVLPPAAGGSQPARFVTSPGVGRFRAAPGALPRRVAKGEIVGFVTSGLARQPVLSPGDGSIGQACQADDTGVGYGEALFTFEQD